MAEKTRSDFDHLPGVRQAQDRLLAHGERSYDAFDSLGLGFDHEEAIDFTFAPLVKYVPGNNLGLVMGVLLMFGATCVEADRLRRADE
jgi:hypothetical protein